MFQTFIKSAFLGLAIISFLGSQNSCATDNDSNISTPPDITRQKNIQTAIQALSPTERWIHFDLQLSESEINRIKALNINLTHEYKVPLLPENFETEITDFIRVIGRPLGSLGVIASDISTNEVNALEISKFIVRLVRDIIAASGEETAKVQLRSFIPTLSFDVPRWHLDNYKHKPHKGAPYKIVIALKGAPTLFYNLPAHQEEKFSELYVKNKGDSQRQQLASLLNGKEAISFAQPNQGTVFFAGGANAPIHSEPAIHETRLFLSVVPGSKIEFQEQLKKEMPSE